MLTKKNTIEDHIELPNGYWLDNKHYRIVELRSLTGADEEFLAQSSTKFLPVTLATHLLSRCITRFDGLDDVTPETIGQLTIGDREALMLHLRRLTFGDHIQGIVECPEASCKELMDFDLRVSDLIQPLNPDPKPAYEHTVLANNQVLQVKFRLPRVLDQETMCLKALSNFSDAITWLVQECILSVRNESGIDVEYQVESIQDIPDRMIELDPQAELVLHFQCSCCETSFSSLFDISSFMFMEAGASLKNLYKEVHLMALHYHWSESELMSMNTKKRRRYLTLLLDSVYQS